jgi:hypothetical protein
MRAGYRSPHITVLNAAISFCRVQSIRGVRITETRFAFGYLITEQSEIQKTETSVVRSLFMNIRKPTKLNGLQANHYVV